MMRIALNENAIAVTTNYLLTIIMRPVIFLSFLFFLLSCRESDKSFDGTVKNYTPIKVDTNCLNPWSDAFFELKTKNFDTVASAIKTKLLAVLGPGTFDETQVLIMQDSLKKAVFTFDSAFILGDIQIDTTNLLGLKDHLNYYTSNRLTPRDNPGWKYYLTQNDLFTFQKTPDFEIGYTFYPCIKKILGKEGKFKRQRKGKSLPEYSKGSDTHVDQINIYNCLMNFSIHISIDDKRGFNNPKRQYYEVRISDTAKVFTTIDLESGK